MVYKYGDGQKESKKLRKLSKLESLKKPKKRQKPKIPKEERYRKKQERVTFIQGKRPDSVQEWRFAMALYRAKLSFIYHYNVFGGTRIRGGMEIDFWVFTVPKVTPVFVQGTYWHRPSKRAEDKYKIQVLKARFGTLIMNPVEVWETELKDIDMAYAWIRRNLQ